MASTFSASQISLNSASWEGSYSTSATSRPPSIDVPPLPRKYFGDSGFFSPTFGVFGKPPKATLVSSGWGGSGNIRSQSSLTASQLKLPGEEEKILQKRRLRPNPRMIKSTGRGGSGNINAATAAQSKPFDASVDPDDQYERVVLQAAQDVKRDKLYSTGRGGTGNLTRTRRVSTGSSSIFSKKTKRKARTNSSEFSPVSPDTGEYEMVPRPGLSNTAPRSAPPMPVLLVYPTSPRGSSETVSLAAKSTDHSQRKEKAGGKEKWWKFRERKAKRKEQAQPEAWTSPTEQPDGDQSFLEFF